MSSHDILMNFVDQMSQAIIERQRLLWYAGLYGLFTTILLLISGFVIWNLCDRIQQLGAGNGPAMDGGGDGIDNEDDAVMALIPDE
jgi:hypothetical protein